MGIKFFKRKKKKQSTYDNDSGSKTLKTLNTPRSNVDMNGAAAAATPETIASPGSPVPQDTELITSSPGAMVITRPSPTSFNQRIMEGETPLVSNVASTFPSSGNHQFGQNRSGDIPPLNNVTPQQTKSNQIRDEIGQYYDERDREEVIVVLAAKYNAKNKVVVEPIEETEVPVTTTFTEHVDHISVRAFSIDASEDVEVQLSLSPARDPDDTKNKENDSMSSRLVPKFVRKIHQDEVSVPSLITEPEGEFNKENVSRLPVVKEVEESQQSESRWSKVSLKNKVMEGQQSIDDAIKSIFGGSTMISAATQAGGIEKLLGFLKCSEDTTTCVPMLQCDALCGPGAKEKDVFDLENEQEQQFAVKFNNEIIREGIKVIYHEPPTIASTSPNWSQSTVKIFLRPGDCLGKKLIQPSLAWAILPVASRFNSVASFDTNEKDMWHRLQLMDVDSIMAAPEEQIIASMSSINKSSFFMITSTSTRSVHIFEAATVMERDYIIRGLKGIMSRLAFNIIAGNTDVIGEHYSEDAGQMTGELPSLRSPRQALRDLTHAFLDQ